MSDNLPDDAEIMAAVEAVMQANRRLFEFGFEQDDFGQFIARGCTVTIYQVGSEYEIDITLPNGSAVGCDVPVKSFKGRTAQEIAAMESDHA
jgi:hypothetical protein